MLRYCGRVTGKEKIRGRRGRVEVLKQWKREGSFCSHLNHLYHYLWMAIWCMFLRGRVLGRRVGGMLLGLGKWLGGRGLPGAQPDAGSKRKTESGGREIYEITSGLWVGMWKWGKGALSEFA